MSNHTSRNIAVRNARVATGTLAARAPRRSLRRFAGHAAVAVLLAGAASTASAQRYNIDLSRIDASQVLALGEDVLLRAPDAAIDRLFHAVHASSRLPDESQALCALFEPDAARDVPAFQRTVDRLGSASRERFALAFTDVALAGLQGQPQPYDPVQARQVLKSAAVSATFLHDGFMAGLMSEGRDAASREARCRSFRWLVGVLVDVPLAERAAATRWLLREGLTLVSAAP
ncbi:MULTISPECIES: hypothetical protein [unclassified Luteimonas]|uniref:hypothetical protein n=1 Tax=unclassified Luteimonas TaxID=2629088 RepID=UPI0016039C68|nr:MULTISPECIES: hypothetical protein [unclassified Luteimonas]MBB1473319.1 hypothetical protein [Luteimonas sp. MC1782]MBB6600507.1 hypothetical protein [Luteimonas sp. MC1825]QOC88168.1 hypothetical protein IDM46_13330 [Luteimonas sp. MC1825]